MEAKGKKMLKVCGIILIIEGIVGILSYGLLTLIFSATTMFSGETEGWLVTLIAVLYLLAAVVSLIAGVLGVKKCADKSAAKKCIFWGSLNLILTVAATWGTSGVDTSLSHMIYMSIGLIVPSLYVSGAYMNKD